MSIVCITGYGIVDALGYTPNECLENYLKEEIFTETFKSSTKIDTRFRSVEVEKLSLPPLVNPSKMSKVTSMLFHSVDHAVNMAGVTSDSNCGTFLTAGAPTDIYEAHFSWYYKQSNRRITPRQVLDGFPASSTALVAQYYSQNSHRAAVPAACATGLYTLDYALRCIDEYDYLVVGTSEVVTDTFVCLFDSLGALANYSTPFDQNRGGFMAGEGSGCLVLETEERAIARGATIYGRIYSPGFAADQGSATSPDPEGKGAILAMKRALDKAGKTSKDIDVVNAHATSTLIGDEVEYNAIREITSAPIFSCKSKIGHLATSCNINELIYSIILSSNGYIGYNTNLNTPINNSYNLPTKISGTRKPTITTLKNSFGFGGRCASVVLDVDNLKGI